MTCDAPAGLLHDEALPWPGLWALDALGLRLAPGPEGPLRDLLALVGLAVRRNPHRAHLVVSRVAGKHVPCDPRRVRRAGTDLGHRVARRLADAADASGTGVADAVVVGIAENATALGHHVAEALDAEHVLATTRRDTPDDRVLASFREPHSHAPWHLLVPDRPERWSPDAPVVLVDDELSTGRTAVACLRALHRVRPRRRYVVASLVDLREPHDRALDDLAAELGAQVEVVALARGRLRLPRGVLGRGVAVASRLGAPVPGPTTIPAGRAAPVTVHLPLGAAGRSLRRGLGRADRAALQAALPGAAAVVGTALGDAPGRVLVLGCEELVHLPIGLAEELAVAGFDVEVAATTRSPAAVLDDPTYALRSGVAFPAHDRAAAPGGTRYAYNLGTPGRARYDTVVLVLDEQARGPALRAPDGLLTRLGELCTRLVEAVVVTPDPRTGLPAPVPARRGPGFGTFAPDEVSWLLDDVTGALPGTPTAERERAVQAGVHYAETLPVERAPSAAYDEAVRCALARAAPRTAQLVGLLTDRVLAARGPDLVLVSLARAGTPLGVLMRRWAQRVRGVTLPHHAVSVIRGRGLDRAALDALTAAHDPGALVLVDGWTGKGSIVDEVAVDLEAYRRETGRAIDPTVAVLADPAHATPWHATRGDELVPWSCLNATACGLVSRTVRRTDLGGTHGYDGAAVLTDLAAADLTAAVLDAVTAHFPTVDPVPTARVPLPADGSERIGVAVVRGLARRFGVDDLSRVKAGLGETTRLLLRREPEVVLLDPAAGADLEPLRVLCRERGVPVRALPPSVDGVPCPYRAVGLVREVR